MEKKTVTRAQGIFILLLLMLLLAVTAYSQLAPQRYEYKEIVFFPDSASRTGDGSEKYKDIDPDMDELNELGRKGWEIVDSYLEMETAYPNFGNPDYITGIQPNVRPQRVVCILKRRILF